MNENQRQCLEATRNYVERLKREHPLKQLFWECTLRCNMACRHCGSDCLKVSAVPDMPLADFLPVLDEVAAHCDPTKVLVNTVGGEPLVRPDLMDCGRAIRERGFYWGLVTNGITLDRSVAREMAQAGINTLSIDVDGTRDDHNWLRNSATGFDRAMRAVEAIQTIPGLTWDTHLPRRPSVSTAARGWTRPWRRQGRRGEYVRNGNSRLRKVGLSTF